MSSANVKRYGPKGVSAPVETQRAVKRLMEAQGEFAAANALGVSRQTIARLAGGMSVHRLTLKGVQDFFLKGAAA